METEQKKTPAEETSASSTTIISNNSVVVNEEDMLPEHLNVKVEDTQRHKLLRSAFEYFSKEYKTPYIMWEKIVDWNNTHCVPPFTEEEADQLWKFHAMNQPSPLANDFSSAEKKISKGKQAHAIITEDPSFQLFHDQSHVGFARITTKNRQVNVPINSSDFMDHVRYKLYTKTRESLSEQQLKESLSLFNAQALYEREQKNLYHRVAHDGDTFYYDLLNETGEVVKIDENGWEIVPSSQVPFLFKQGSGKQQVLPQRGGNLTDLLELINIKDTEGQMMYLSTLPVRLIRDIDQAIVYLHGSAGSGKTTLLKMTKDLLDPSKGGISMPIRRVEDATVLLNQTWIFANDNISRIDDDLSDFLCVVATGAESSKRKLYSDSDVSVLSVKNPAYLTGINVEAYKSDLLSRLLLFKTSIVPDELKLGDETINKKFTELKPFLLGALFDILSKAIRIKKQLTHKTSFRMVDFALWSSACAEALGYGALNFEKALQNSVKQRAYDAIYSLSAGRALLGYVEDNGSYEGTVTDLFIKLKENYNNDWHEAVANNPSSLGKKLRELENSLAVIGIQIDFTNRSGSERRIIIRKIDTKEDSKTQSEIVDSF